MVQEAPKEDTVSPKLLGFEKEGEEAESEEEEEEDEEIRGEEPRNRTLILVHWSRTEIF